MKRAALLILCILFCSVSYAQTFTIPGLAKLEQDQVLDTIDKWYVKEILPFSDTSKTLPLLRSFTMYADQTNNVVLKAAAKFYLGNHYFHLHYHYKELGYDSLSIKLMEDAIASIDRDQNKYVWVSFMHDLATIYDRNENYAKSLEYQLRAMEGYKELGIENYPNAAEVASGLSFFYYHLGNYMASLEVLLPIANIKFDPIYTLQINNTIGLAYREMDRFDSAIYFFTKTMNLARKIKDVAWIGIAAGNISATYIKQNQYAKADPYARLYYECVLKDSTRFSPTSIGESLIYLAEINLFYNKTDDAIKQLKEAEKYILKAKLWYSANVNYKFMKRIYKGLARAYITKDKSPLVLEYMMKEKEVDDSLARNNFIGQYTKVQLQLQVEKNLSQSKLVNKELKLSIQRRNFSLIALILLGLLILTLYNRQRLKNKKDWEIMGIERRRSEENLATYVNNLQEKNKMIEDFQYEIEWLKNILSDPQKIQTTETLIKLQQSKIITEAGWLQFKDLFNQAHKGFFIRLNKKYPDLTQAEIRLLTLTKLNISTREMGNILGIAPESIRKARYRLLKKIRMPESTNLDEIVKFL
jgi:DNA-binding CsgD family transcriptional regulator